MANPKRKHSKSRRDKRRTHYKLAMPHHVESCPNCGEPKERHRVCRNCGFYRGRQILSPVRSA
jgi:large subunit ribosomal protein L32|nr:MAG: 50S ribosomal protein L32 [Bacteroidota bacterium]